MITYSIETYGCQMNVYDSDRLQSLLEAHGFTPAESAETADIVLLNTCSVRDRAEQRVLGRVHQLGSRKKEDLRLIGLIGCMAERLREELFHLAPELDFVVGPGQLESIPDLLNDLLDPGHGLNREVRTGLVEGEPVGAGGQGTLSDFVAISRGCDNWCSYCIVPSVRGPERSRPLSTILDEARAKVASGTREITFLGQNVNSYRDDGSDFPALLRAAAEMEGLWRIRFATSHPKDCSPLLLETMAQCDQVMPQLHLPAQSGSDRILQAMNRKYTSAHYLGLITAARALVPDLHLTTDLIVGFPGETEADFESTLELVRQCGFDNAFTFRYSVRPGTKAAEMPDDVPEQVKLERLERLIAAIREQAQTRVRLLLGSEQEVLIMGGNPRGAGSRGQVRGGRVMILSGERPVGSLVRARVSSIRGATLFGE